MNIKDHFNKLKKRQEEENLRNEAEQSLRKEHLAQLKSQHTTRSSIFHPLESRKRKKEIKQLQQEIDAYESKKQAKKSLPIIIIILAVSFCGLLIMEKSAEKDAAPSSSPGVELYDTIPTDSSNNKNSEDSAAANSDNRDFDSSTNVDNSKLDDDLAVDSESHLTAKDLTVRTRTDYAHSGGSVTLGQDEGVTITIKAENNTLDISDIILIYDETLLTVTIAKKDDSTLDAYVTGNIACNTDISIYTAYDVAVNNTDIEGYTIDIVKLDAENGSIVYTTPYGEKYHVSEACAGENATKTTRYDAMALGYTPCRKCS